VSEEEESKREETEKERLRTIKEKDGEGGSAEELTDILRRQLQRIDSIKICTFENIESFNQ